MHRTYVSQGSFFEEEWREKAPFLLPILRRAFIGGLKWVCSDGL